MWQEVETDPCTRHYEEQKNQGFDFVVERDEQGNNPLSYSFIGHKATLLAKYLAIEQTPGKRSSYPNYPNSETPFHIPLSLSHCSSTRFTTISRRWLGDFQSFERFIDVQEQHNNAENRDHERHFDCKILRHSDGKVPSCVFRRRTQRALLNTLYLRFEAMQR